MMGYGVLLRVWGERALFTRPEMKVERASYDVPTPSAARGMLEAIHWKPQIVWRIDRIHVLKKIAFAAFRRNEVNDVISAKDVRGALRRQDVGSLSLDVARRDKRAQRTTTFLIDVDYIIAAHFEMTAKSNGDDPAKHLAMFNRRAEAGQCFHRPCLGTCECPADFALVEAGTPLPECGLPVDQRDRDLGWMLHDIDFENDRTSRFFRARLTDGVLDVNRCLADGVAA